MVHRPRKDDPFHFNPMGPQTLLYQSKATSRDSGTYLFVRTRRRMRERFGVTETTGEELFFSLDVPRCQVDLGPLQNAMNSSSSQTMLVPTIPAVETHSFEQLVLEQAS